MEILKEYQSQYEEFCNIDDFNIEERAKRIPAEKHFWVCRLIDAKIEKDKLYKIKAQSKKTLERKVIEESPVKLNKQIMDALEESPTLETLNQKIREQEFIVEYLERLVSQISFIAQDIKNIIEIKRLQEM